MRRLESQINEYEHLIVVVTALKAIQKHSPGYVAGLTGC